VCVLELLAADDLSVHVRDAPLGGGLRGGREGGRGGGRGEIVGRRKV